VGPPTGSTARVQWVPTRALPSGAWAGRPVFEFWDQVRSTMLTTTRLAKPGEYLDILAYVLRLNG
jgi:hypothetical protein